MGYRFDYSREKDLILKEARGIGFEEVISAYKLGKKIADFKNKKQKYLNQRVLIVEIDKYAYAVPYVIDLSRNRIFLKTIYPSRKLTKKYLSKK